MTTEDRYTKFQRLLAEYRKAVEDYAFLKHQDESVSVQEAESAKDIIEANRLRLTAVAMNHPGSEL